MLNKIQIMSDLHLDFPDDKGKKFIASLDSCGVTVLVIAGDLCEIRHESFERMVRTICEKYPEVVYTPGNHEWWNGDIAANQAKLDMLSAKYKNFHVLQNRVVTIRGQRFVGTTMWFRDTSNARIRYKKWCDFKNITGLDPWVWDEIKKAREFLEAEVKPGDVVVTHHLPLHLSIDQRFCGKDGQAGTNIFYLNDMYDLFCRGGPALWIHGHSHMACDYKAGDTRVICNPRGYPWETWGTGYRERLIVELGTPPTEAHQEYMTLMAELIVLRKERNNEDCPEEEPLLERMDELWWKQTDEERTQIEKMPSTFSKAPLLQDSPA